MNVDEKLLRRYLTDQCTPEEKAFVDTWYAERKMEGAHSADEVDRIVQALDKRIRRLTPGNRRIGFTWWASSAAAVLVLIGIGAFWHLQIASTLSDVAAPVGANTIIVFEDNTEFDLDLLKEGDTIRAHDYLITRIEQGEVKYLRSLNTESNAEVVYNTVRTRAGGITSLILEDGSKVWVNSKSEITYPISFSDELREVALKGEAYFEIATQPDRPFFVRTSNHTIKVLGTKFNVNNKQDDYISTLLEGRIAVAPLGTQLGDRSEPGFPFLMHPHQVFADNEVTTIENVNKAIDWKEGYFDFSDMTVEQVSYKMAEWYDVDFHIGENLRNKRVYGQISRDKSLRQVLELIEKVLPIQYKITNKQIYIYSQSN